MKAAETRMVARAFSTSSNGFLQALASRRTAPPIPGCMPDQHRPAAAPRLLAADQRCSSSSGGLRTASEPVVHRRRRHRRPPRCPGCSGLA